jgi:hypothetical protein
MNHSSLTQDSSLPLTPSESWTAFEEQEHTFHSQLKVRNSPCQQVYTLKACLTETGGLRLQAFSADEVFSLELQAGDVPRQPHGTSLLWVKLLIESACRANTLELYGVDDRHLSLTSLFEVSSRDLSEECVQPKALSLRVLYQLDGTPCSISIQLPKILHPIWVSPQPISPRSSELIRAYLSTNAGSGYEGDMRLFS